MGLLYESEEVSLFEFSDENSVAIYDKTTRVTSFVTNVENVEDLIAQLSCDETFDITSDL